MAGLTPEDERALAEPRASLLRKPRPNLGPDQGDEAYDQHVLLAAAILRAARLYRSDGDGKTWCKYVKWLFATAQSAAGKAASHSGAAA